MCHSKSSTIVRFDKLFIELDGLGKLKRQYECKVWQMGRVNQTKSVVSYFDVERPDRWVVTLVPRQHTTTFIMEMRVPGFIVFDKFKDIRTYGIIVSHFHSVLTKLVATHVNTRVWIFVYTGIFSDRSSKCIDIFSDNFTRKSRIRWRV